MPTTDLPPFHATIQPAPPAVTTSWRPGCPVARSALRLLTVTYRGFDGRAHDGRIVIAVRVAPGVVKVFRSLYDAGYPIRRMVPIDAYGNDDNRSLAADNTAGFNCRRAVGGSGWSMHANGEAIDVNPVENPYVLGSQVLPPAGRRFLSRPSLRGVIHHGDAVWRAFRAIGWRWGGDWRGAVDYQHFSSTGR
jgi:hypothetical protein